MGDLPQWAVSMYSANTETEILKTISLYEQFYETNPFQKTAHTQYYKRWIRRLGRNMDHLADDHNLSHFQNRIDYLKQFERSDELKSNAANWLPIGPFDFDIDAEVRSYAPGAAHMYTIEQSLSNPDVLYAGSATAGLWKTSDHGLNWSLVTSDIISNQVKALEINPQDSESVFMGTEGGLYQTANGGVSWNQIPIDGQSHLIHDIIQLQTNSNILLVASDKGLYRSDNSGSSWNQIIACPATNQEIQELEIHPNNENIIYLVKRNDYKTQFYKSSDAGLNFALKTNGWPNPDSESNAHQRRTEIAVSPAKPDYVYALAAGQANGGSGLFGFYVSNNAGESWSFKCCGSGPGGSASSSNRNILGYSSSGTSTGGQFYYDLALDVSHTSPVTVLAGGINIWRSSDDGQSWSNNAGWTIFDQEDRYVHADIHDIRYYGNDLWVASDGGIFYSSNNANDFNKRMYGIQGTDFRGFGVGHQDGSVMVGGTFHNSTLLMNGNVYLTGWVSTVIGGTGGDNTRGFVNPGIADNVYIDKSGARGRVQLPSDRSLPLMVFDFDKQPNASYTTGNSCNLAFHPNFYKSIFSGVGDQLWQTNDNGLSWNLIHDFNGGKIVNIEISDSNPDLILVVQLFGIGGSPTKLWKSTDGGQSWQNVVPSFPSYDHYPLNVQIQSDNSQNIWLARLAPFSNSNLLDGNKVYYSSNGGQSWSNITTSDLNGERITNIVHQKGTTGVYLGTRRTVYYKNTNMSSWEMYNQNLPASTYSTRLVPYYFGSKLINGTNRGAFETPFYEPSNPIAIPSVDKDIANCIRDTFYFADLSSVSSNNVSWLWSFTNATPSSSTLRNPKVVFNQAGTHNVTLTVSDAHGSSTITKTNMITVLPGCSISEVPGKTLKFHGNTFDYMEAPPINETLSELTIMAWVYPEGSQGDLSAICHWEESNGLATGLYIDEDNRLRYQWRSQNLGFDSGHYLVPDEWNHVALVITNNKAMLYLNGVSDNKNGGNMPINFNMPLRVGINGQTSGPGLNGMIDELSIWRTDLSKTQVRLNRHLTLEEPLDQNLVSYYQFNLDDQMVADVAGSLHGTLYGNTQKLISSGPFGGGISEKQSVQFSGTYQFAGPQVTMEFSPGDTPNGDIYVSRINVPPDEYSGGASPHSDAYWIINNYGSNEVFDAASLLQFDNIGYVSVNEQMAPDMLLLFKRESNAHGDTWGMPADMADIAISGSSGSVGFENSISTFSQFIIARHMVVPINLLRFNAKKESNNNVLLSWESAAEINFHHFEVERSIDGRAFTKIETVNRNSSMKYSHLDKHAVLGNNYYRLKLVDQNGSYRYSEIQTVFLSQESVKFQLFPNPVVSGKQLNIQVKSIDSGSFQMYSSSGVLISELHTIEGVNKLDISKLSPGIYFYTFNSPTYKKQGALVVE